VPEPDRVEGLIEPHVNPDGRVSFSDTVPEKPFCAVIVIVELVDWPALTAAGEVAEMVKSGAGGLRGRNVSRHPQPMGLLLHCIAPYVPAPGVLVQLPAGHQTQLIR
jgi:hypothetical protein